MPPAKTAKGHAKSAKAPTSESVAEVSEPLRKSRAPSTAPSTAPSENQDEEEGPEEESLEEEGSKESNEQSNNRYDNAMVTVNIHKLKPIDQLDPTIKAFLNAKDDARIKELLMLLPANLEYFENQNRVVREMGLMSYKIQQFLNNNTFWTHPRRNAVLLAQKKIDDALEGFKSKKYDSALQGIYQANELGYNSRVVPVEPLDIPALPQLEEIIIPANNYPENYLINNRTYFREETNEKLAEEIVSDTFLKNLPVHLDFLTNVKAGGNAKILKKEAAKAFKDNLLALAGDIVGRGPNSADVFNNALGIYKSINEVIDKSYNTHKNPPNEEFLVTHPFHNDWNNLPDISKGREEFLNRKNEYSVMMAQMDDIINFVRRYYEPDEKGKVKTLAPSYFHRLTDFQGETLFLNAKVNHADEVMYNNGYPILNTFEVSADAPEDATDNKEYMFDEEDINEIKKVIQKYRDGKITFNPSDKNDERIDPLTIQEIHGWITKPNEFLAKVAKEEQMTGPSVVTEEEEANIPDEWPSTQKSVRVKQEGESNALSNNDQSGSASDAINFEATRAVDDIADQFGTQAVLKAAAERAGYEIGGGEEPSNAITNQTVVFNAPAQSNIIPTLSADDPTLIDRSIQKWDDADDLSDSLTKRRDTYIRDVQDFGTAMNHGDMDQAITALKNGFNKINDQYINEESFDSEIGYAEAKNRMKTPRDIALENLYSQFDFISKVAGITLPPAEFEKIQYISNFLTQMWNRVLRFTEDRKNDEINYERIITDQKERIEALLATHIAQESYGQRLGDAAEELKNENEYLREIVERLRETDIENKRAMEQLRIDAEEFATVYHKQGALQQAQMNAALDHVAMVEKLNQMKAGAINELEQQIDELQQQLAAGRAQMQRLEDEKLELQNRYDGVIDYAAQKEAEDSEARRFQEDEYKEEINNLQNELANNNLEIEKIKGEVEGREEEIANMHNVINNYHNQLMAEQEEVIRLRNMLFDFEQRLQNEINDKQRLQNEINDQQRLQNERNDKKNTIKFLQEKLKLYETKQFAARLQEAADSADNRPAGVDAGINPDRSMFTDKPVQAANELDLIEIERLKELNQELDEYAKDLKIRYEEEIEELKERLKNRGNKAIDDLRLKHQLGEQHKRAMSEIEINKLQKLNQVKRSQELFDQQLVLNRYAFRKNVDENMAERRDYRKLDLKAKAAGDKVTSRMILNNRFADLLMQLTGTGNPALMAYATGMFYDFLKSAANLSDDELAARDINTILNMYDKGAIGRMVAAIGSQKQSSVEDSLSKRISDLENTTRNFISLLSQRTAHVGAAAAYHPPRRVFVGRNGVAYQGNRRARTSKSPRRGPPRKANGQFKRKAKR